LSNAQAEFTKSFLTRQIEGRLKPATLDLKTGHQGLDPASTAIEDWKSP